MASSKCDGGNCKSCLGAIRDLAFSVCAPSKARSRKPPLPALDDPLCNSVDAQAYSRDYSEQGDVGGTPGPKIDAGCTLAVSGASGAGGSLEWLNSLLHRFWPFIDKACVQILHEKVEPLMRQKLLAFRFSKFTLGQEPPSLGPVSIVPMDHGEGVALTIGLHYESDVDISVSAGPVALGVRKLSLHGELHVQFDPLLPEPPVIGAMQVFFLDIPKVDMDFTGLANVADCPVISQMLRDVIAAALTEKLTVPRVMALQFGTNGQVGDHSLKSLKPLGMLRTTLVSAKGLQAADWNLLGKATSDPYVLFHLAGQSFKSTTVRATCDPVWPREGNTCDLIVYHKHQRLRVSVFDEDQMSADDDIGCEEIDLRAILSSDLLSKPMHVIALHSKEHVRRQNHPEGPDGSGSRAPRQRAVLDLPSRDLEEPGKLGPLGSLSLRFDFLATAPHRMDSSVLQNSADAEDMMMISFHISAAKFDYAATREAPDAISVRISLDGESKDTPSTTAAEKAAEVDVIKQQALLAATKLQREQVSWDIISRVTGCTQVDLLAAATDGEDVSKAPAPPYDFQTALFFTRPQCKVKKAVVKIELVTADGTAISSVSLPLLEALQQRDDNAYGLRLQGSGAKPLHARLRLFADARGLVPGGAHWNVDSLSSNLTMHGRAPLGANVVASDTLEAAEEQGLHTEPQNIIDIVEFSPSGLQPGGPRGATGHQPIFASSFVCCASALPDAQGPSPCGDDAFFSL